MKRIVRILAILVAILVLALICVPFLIDANQFRPMLESDLTAALGRPVKVGNLKLSILSGSVGADDLSIADDPAFSQAPFVAAKSLKLGVDVHALVFSRTLHVTGLAIDAPAVTLLQSPAGAWNFSSLGARSTAKSAPATPAAPAGANLDLSVNLVKITGGRFSLGKTHTSAKPLVLDKVTVELRDFSPAAAFPFSFSASLGGGGTLQLDGRAGPINSGDTARTPVEMKLKAAGVNLAAPGMLDVPGLAGIASLDGSGSSDGRTVRIQGHLQAERLKLAKDGTPARRPVAFDFVLAHDVEKRSGTISRGDIRIGSAPASLTGAYAQHGESTSVNLILAGPKMPVSELVEMLPPLGVVLPAGSSLQGGTAFAKLSSEGPLDRLVTTGSLGLENTRLAGFNLGSKMAAIETFAGIKGGPDTDLQTVQANVRVAPDGTAANDIRIVAPAIGELTGSGTVSPAKALDFKMRATLHTSGGVMAALGQKGDTSVPFSIAGTASDPVFRPDMKAVVNEQVKRVGEDAVGKAAGGLLQGLFGKKKQQ